MYVVPNYNGSCMFYLPKDLKFWSAILGNMTSLIDRGVFFPWLTDLNCLEFSEFLFTFIMQSLVRKNPATTMSLAHDCVFTVDITSKFTKLKEHSPFLQTDILCLGSLLCDVITLAKTYFNMCICNTECCIFALPFILKYNPKNMYCKTNRFLL